MKVVSSVSQTITRPADTTAYASGDLVANSVTAGSVTPFQFYIPYGRGFELMRITLSKSATGVTNANFRLHLFRDSPTVANGDNGAISASASGYIGSFDLDGTADIAVTGSGRIAKTPTANPTYLFLDLDQIIFGLLEARAAYAPANAETFSIELNGKAYV